MPEDDRPLSPQMQHALEILSRGKSRRQAATEMGISPHTLNTYLSKAFERLAVHKAIAAIAKALARGLLK